MLEVESRSASSPHTHKRVFKSGHCVELAQSQSCRPSPGTTVTVYDLFHALPVRKLCLNTPLELEHIKQRLEAVALIHPSVSFSLRNEDSASMILQTHKANSVLGAFSHLFGARKASSLLPVQDQTGVYRIDGYLSTECHYNKALQYLYINERFVLKCRLHKLVKQVLSASTILQKVTASGSPSRGTFPKATKACGIYILNICCPTSVYDIIVEPGKTLVEFADWSAVLHCVEQALNAVLQKANLLVTERSEDPANVLSEQDTDRCTAAVSSPHISTVAMSGTKHSWLVSRLQRNTTSTVTKQVDTANVVTQPADRALDVTQQADPPLDVTQTADPPLDVVHQEGSKLDVAWKADAALDEEESTAGSVQTDTVLDAAHQANQTPDLSANSETALGVVAGKLPRQGPASQHVHVMQKSGLFHSLHTLRQLHSQNKSCERQPTTGNRDLTVESLVMDVEQRSCMRIPQVARKTGGVTTSGCSHIPKIDVRGKHVVSHMKRKTEMSTGSGAIAAKVTKLGSQTAGGSNGLKQCQEHRLQTTSRDEVRNCRTVVQWGQNVDSVSEKSGTSVEHTSHNRNNTGQLSSDKSDGPECMSDSSPHLEPISNDNSAPSEHKSGHHSAVVEHQPNNNNSVGVKQNNSVSMERASDRSSEDAESTSPSSRVCTSEDTSPSSKVCTSENKASMKCTFDDQSVGQEVARESSGVVEHLAVTMETPQPLSVKSVDVQWQTLSHEAGTVMCMNQTIAYCMYTNSEA